MIHFKSLALFFISMLFLSSCVDENVTPESRISDDFILTGTWYFQVISGEGVIRGVATEDNDPEPGGFVTFNEDGTGFSDFNVNLLDMPYGKEESITWERLNNSQVLITEADGDEDLWNLIRANENVVEASWEIFFSDIDNAVITAILTSEP